MQNDKICTALILRFWKVYKFLHFQPKTRAMKCFCPIYKKIRDFSFFVYHKYYKNYKDYRFQFPQFKNCWRARIFKKIYFFILNVTINYTFVHFCPFMPYFDDYLRLCTTFRFIETSQHDAHVFSPKNCYKNSFFCKEIRQNASLMVLLEISTALLMFRSLWTPSVHF